MKFSSYSGTEFSTWVHLTIFIIFSGIFISFGIILGFWTRKNLSDEAAARNTPQGVRYFHQFAVIITVPDSCNNNSNYGTNDSLYTIQYKFVEDSNLYYSHFTNSVFVLSNFSIVQVGNFFKNESHNIVLCSIIFTNGCKFDSLSDIS